MDFTLVVTSLRGASISAPLPFAIHQMLLFSTSRRSLWQRDGGGIKRAKVWWYFFFYSGLNWTAANKLAAWPTSNLIIGLGTRCLKDWPFCTFLFSIVCERAWKSPFLFPIHFWIHFSIYRQPYLVHEPLAFGKPRSIFECPDETLYSKRVQFVFRSCLGLADCLFETFST